MAEIDYEDLVKQAEQAVAPVKDPELKRYDAAAVMMRRLLETSIIEAFETHHLDGKIKNAQGDFFQLSDLVGAALSETKLSHQMGRGLVAWRRAAGITGTRLVLTHETLVLSPTSDLVSKIRLLRILYSSFSIRRPLDFSAVSSGRFVPKSTTFRLS